MAEIRLHWEGLVEAVRNNEHEPQDVDGNTLFLYCETRNVFVSDPDFINDVQKAREHKHPFMLIGKMGTGKNVFLELVAKGKPPFSESRPCIDENIDGTQEEMMTKFFGDDGIVLNNPNALIHFDLLQSAIEWPVFVDKIHQLAKYGKVLRRNNEVNVRVVGGATVDLETHVTLTSPTSFSYLYNYLASNQLARTKSLRAQSERMQSILAEQLASQVLDNRSNISEKDLRKAEKISETNLKILENHSWPGEFYELVRLVKEAVFLGSWDLAISNSIPLGVVNQTKRILQGTPTRKPEEKGKSDHVFILMPMRRDDLNLEETHLAIVRAASRVGLRAERVDDISFVESIPDKVFECIHAAKYIIADLTYQRPSVFFELGYATAFDKKSILTAREGTDLTFYVSTYPVHYYSSDKELEAQLIRLLTSLEKTESPD